MNISESPGSHGSPQIFTDFEQVKMKTAEDAEDKKFSQVEPPRPLRPLWLWLSSLPWKIRDIRGGLDFPFALLDFFATLISPFAFFAAVKARRP